MDASNAFVDGCAYSFVCVLGSHLGVQGPKYFNRYSERRDTVCHYLHKQSAQSGKAPGNLPLHLPVLPVAAYSQFWAWYGINPSPFYLIS